MESIKEVLMRRDGLEDYEADDLIQEASEALEEYIFTGDLQGAEDLINDYFGLEPDYLWEIMPI